MIPVGRCIQVQDSSKTAHCLLKHEDYCNLFKNAPDLCPNYYEAPGVNNRTFVPPQENESHKEKFSR